MKPLVAAGFVIFRKLHNTPEYLLLQASYGDFHWSPPKGKNKFDVIRQSHKSFILGHVDPGETDEIVTAFRETEEETGLRKSDIQVLLDSKKVLEYEVRGKPKKVIYWLAQLLDGNKSITLSSEHQDMKWLNCEEACRLGKYKEMRELIEFCENYINTHCN